MLLHYMQENSTEVIHPISTEKCARVDATSLFLIRTDARMIPND